MRVRTIAATAAATAAAFVVALIGAAGSRNPDPALATRGPLTAADQIAAAEAVLARAPGDEHALANLASAALTQMKQTGDPSWYTRADIAVGKALAVNPRNVLALETKATLANARHRFADAVGPALAAARLAPDRFASLEILTDARIELGRYREGFATAERRLRLRPDLSSYSRASYAAELRGERDLAIRLMQGAVDSGRPGSADRTWAQVQLALLRLGSGDLAGARREVAEARRVNPQDPTALAGDAHVRAVSGDLDAAADLYRQALSHQKVAGFAAGLAEVESARGNEAAADEALALAREIDARETTHGVRLALDQAAVEADFSVPDAAAVARALRHHADRPGVVGDDAVGWVLTRSGRCDEGLRFARKSLRLGTRDASMFFHAGMAAKCAGRRGEAVMYLRKVRDLNPRFSVRWANTAKTALAELTR